jgi:hypothetical protein
MNLLSNDDQFGVQRLSRAGPGNRVVVGDDHALDTFPAASLYKTLGRSEGVFGIVGMAMEFNF